MQNILERFNAKYQKSKTIVVNFIDENPLSVRKIRYNQGGAVCYCMDGQSQAKQKTKNGWQPVACTSECNYCNSADGISKPMCNLEGTLKFMLPDICNDRIWIMKLTGKTSIKRIKSYIELQKQLGNSLKGNYTLFLKQEEQTNKEGKTFNNYILDIVKNENFSPNILNFNNQNIQSNQTKSSNNNETKVNNVVESKASNTVAEQKNVTNNNAVEQNANEVSKENNKKQETKKSEKTTKSKITKQTEDTSKEAQKQQTTEKQENIDEYYALIETKATTFMKDGKPKEYIIGSFVDSKDKPIDVIIPPQFAEELLECDLGTFVKLNIAKVGDKTFTNNVEYIQKCVKKVAA